MSAISIDIEEREQNKKEKFLFIIIVLAKDGVWQEHISHCQTQFERISVSLVNLHILAFKMF